MGRHWACARPWAPWSTSGGVCCCPIRFMMPTKRRSRYGAAAWHPSTQHCATADSQSAAGSSRPHGLPEPTSYLLNTPWNPVGTVLNREELADIMGFAEKNDYLVISDEIYESLVYDGLRHVSPASVSADARERTVVINSLSKTYAMTGWRVGYCAGPEQIIRAMFLVLQQSSRGPATFVQDAAACALTSDQECVRRMAAEYQIVATGSSNGCVAYRASSRSSPRGDCS